MTLDQLFTQVFPEHEVLDVSNLVHPARVHGYACGHLLDPTVAIIDADGDTIARGVSLEDAIIDGLAREYARLSNFEDSIRTAAHEKSKADRTINELLRL